MDTDSDATQAQGTSSGPKVIRANQFVLEDATGTARAALGVGKDGRPWLLLLDAKGTVRTWIGEAKYGPRLLLADENGTTRATLGVSEHGPSLLLLDAKGKTIWSPR